MSKIFTVAWNEYRNVVFTKSFLFGLLLPILIYGGMIVIMILVGGRTDVDTRKLVVVDRTGQVLPAVENAVLAYNRSDSVYKASGEQVGPLFEVEPREAGEKTDVELELELSDRVREGAVFAFAIIGPDYLSPEGGEGDYLSYYSNAPTFNALPNWLASVVKDHVEEQRLQAAGLDAREIRRLFSHNELQRFNLAERGPDGSVVKPRKENPFFTIFVPLIAVMMIFFAVQTVSPVMLNSVIEEKMQRIAEVLLSNVSATQLLWGKLLAGTSVGLTFSLVYMTTGVLALAQFGRADYLPMLFLPFFFLFLVSMLLAFGAVLGGISAACQDLKDSQNMAGLVVILLIIPMVLSMSIADAPDSSFARFMSFVPVFSPMIMSIRMAVPPGPELWEPVVALIVNFVFAVLAVGAGARIFRIGILAQGKTPTWRELFRWAMRG